MTRHVRIIQRLEGGAVALGALAVVLVAYLGWWWVILAAFLVFDLSMLGYVRSTAAGAISYNAVHNYALPALAGLAALALRTDSPDASRVVGLLACAWAFHVGFDRTLGYGLKLPHSFRSTHLGEIGNRRTMHRGPLLEEAPGSGPTDRLNSDNAAVEPVELEPRHMD